MSDHREDLPESTPPEVREEPKKKRQLSEKQLANLAKAREKAQVTLKAKRERTKKLKAEEKKLKELRIKEREDKIAAELKVMQSNQDQEEQAPAPEKPKKKAKKKRVVYYSDSSSEDEIEYRPKPKRKPVPRKERPPPQPQPVLHDASEQQRRAEDAAIEHEYKMKLRRMRKEMIMKSVFPNM